MHDREACGIRDRHPLWPPIRDRGLPFSRRELLQRDRPERLRFHHSVIEGIDCDAITAGIGNRACGGVESLPVATECEAEEIRTARRIFCRIRKIRQLVCFQIEHPDGLRRARPVVQDREPLFVRTGRSSDRKTVGLLAMHSGGCYAFARGKKISVAHSKCRGDRGEQQQADCALVQQATGRFTRKMIRDRLHEECVYLSARIGKSANEIQRLPCRGRNNE